MAIIHQKDSRSGITYVYEAKYFRDKEKKYPRSTRTLIGRFDPETGETVPTDGRMKRAKEKQEIAEPKRNKFDQSKRSFYGATYLLDEIGNKLGITEDLKRCFADSYEQLLSIAYFLIMEDTNALSRFEKWGITHKHPYGRDIPSQRSSELFQNISQEQINQFMRLQGKRRMDKEYWLYDITFISGYSETLNQVQYGHNKEHDKLPQLNLALVYGEQSNLPFYYRKLAGNIPDVKTVKGLLADLGILGFDKLKLVMDKGFFSVENINALYKEHYKFLVSTKLNLSIVKETLDKIYDDFQSFENYNEDHQLYSMTVPCEWEYTQQRPNKNDKLKEKRRVYVHLYYNIDRMVEDQKNFNRKLTKWKQEILSDSRKPENEKYYDKYFFIKKTPVRGIEVKVNEEAVKETKRYYGFFALLSNDKMETISALELYRNKDLVEKAFGNLKERLNLRRTLVSSEQSLDGKIFVEFLALIYLSYIKKQIQVKKIGKDYTIASLLDKLDVIECFENPGKRLRVGEILEKQQQLYLDMEVKIPK
jgi:transposase